MKRLSVLASLVILWCLVAISGRARDIRPGYQIPLQNYAVINVSGTTTGGVTVTDIALDDDNNAAFGIYITSSDIYGTSNLEYKAYTWKDGAAALRTTLSLTSHDFGDSNQYTWFYYDPLLMPNGKVGCTYIETWPDSGPHGIERACIVEGNPGGGVGLGNPGPDNVALPAPLQNSNWYYGLGGVSCILSDTAYAFTASYSFPTNDPRALKDQSGMGICYSSFIFHDGIYDAFLMPSWVPMNSGSRHEESFFPWRINARGRGWGWLEIPFDPTIRFWDGTNLSTPFGASDTPMDLNDQNEVVVSEATPGEGYLWNVSASATTPLITVLATLVQGQYHDIQPFSIGNQAAPPASPSPDKTIHILSDAQNSGNGGGNGATEKVLLKRDNAAKWTFAKIQLPVGTNITDWNTINSSGVIAAIGTTPATSSTAALLLVPVTLTQTNYPTNVLPDGSDVQLTSTTQAISSGTVGSDCTAYITGAPAMPTLQVSIANGSLSGMKVQWWMTATTDRPAARGTQDNVQIPNPQIGYRTLSINQAWEIDSDYGGQFFGRICTIHYVIQDSNGNALTPEQTYPFLIRGRNSKDANALGYVDDNEDNYDYAWAIAQHESRTPSGKIYNQFATANGSSWGDLGQPFYAKVEGNGWGMFQRDPTGGGLPVTTAQLYNWQSNTQAAIEELADKWTTTDRLLRYFRNKYGNKPGWEEPPQSYLISNSRLSAWDLGTIVLYNTSKGCPTSSVTDDNGNSITIQFPWTFNLNGVPGSKWHFQDNVKNYATHVIEDEWEAGLPYNE